MPERGRAQALPGPLDTVAAMSEPADQREPRPGSRRDRILAEAMALADERGLDAVTMRAVAERVGVTPMALYPHVGGKQALLDGLLERLLAELPIPPDELSWQDRLRALARSLRDTGRAHPGVFPLLLARPATTVGSLRVVEALYAALLDAGVPAPEVARAERLVSTFAIGFVASEVTGRFGPGSATPRQRRTMLDPDRFPAHHMLASHLDAQVDWDAEFESDLDALTVLLGGVIRR